MNQDSRRRLWRALVPAAAAGIALLAAACSGGSSPPSAAGPPDVQKALAYATCMRAHGAPGWPDPNTQGQFTRTAAGSAAFRAPAPAYQACAHLLPDHGQIPPPVQHQVTLLALKFAGCMRMHGIPNFPDPVGSGFEFARPAGFNPQSPQAQAAQQACRKYSQAAVKMLPPGLRPAAAQQPAHTPMVVA